MVTSWSNAPLAAPESIAASARLNASPSCFSFFVATKAVAALIHAISRYAPNSPSSNARNFPALKVASPPLIASRGALDTPKSDGLITNS